MIIAEEGTCCAGWQPALPKTDLAVRREREEGFITQNARDGAEILTPRTAFGMTWSVGGLLEKRNFGAEEGILLCRLAAGATKSDLASRRKGYPG
jgi:hypothetical protein